MTIHLRFLGLAALGVATVGTAALSAACSNDARNPGTKPAAASKAVELRPMSASLGDANLDTHWVGSKAQDALEAFTRRDYAGARAAFAELSIDDTALSCRRDLMVALCDAKLGNHTRAAKTLEESLAQMPHLANFLHFSAASSYFFAKQLETALGHALAVETNSIHGADAELLVGDILRGQGDAKSIYHHYRDYLSSRPSGLRRAEARFYKAKAAASLGKHEEAKRHWVTIMSSAPLSRWAEKAETLLGSDVVLSADALITRGRIYYRKNRNEKSEADFAAALKVGGLAAGVRCDASYHQANSVYKQRDRTRAAPLFVRALKECDAGVNADLYVKAAYQAGRSFATLGENAKALAHYALIEAKHPAHSYADDARLLQAETYEKLGDAKNVEKLLASMPDAYPDGDMATEALWRLAWRAYKAKNYEEAIEWLEKQIDSRPIDTRFWAEGQAHYWLARSHGKRGKTEASLAAYRQVINDYPLSYYALLALNRIRESHPKHFQEIQRDIRSESEQSSQEGRLQFREREEYKSEAFARALEFLRLGLPRPASAELHRLGFRSPPGREPLTDPDEIDKAWAVSYLHHSIGNYGKALWSTRWHLLDFKRHWPTSGWRQRWEIAYPPGYGDLIERFARQQGIPRELVMSFVREESGFDPIQESFANAIGLSQLIIPTAKRFAKGTGIAVSRETLRVPENNIQIGTNFMAFLMKKWNQQISLVAPSYNAGESAVGRWMKERGEWDRDAFAEEIPYDETRRYSKRVIASYFTYRYLLHGEIPVFPN
ncbi:MAG: transglycosylase SLT domain-containing protein [Myxococcales bacterium]|nr:transglycosylase SLT domain-containing protein [Myxococcales bacterium]